MGQELPDALLFAVLTNTDKFFIILVIIMGRRSDTKDNRVSGKGNQYTHDISTSKYTSIRE